MPNAPAVIADTAAMFAKAFQFLLTAASMPSTVQTPAITKTLGVVVKTSTVATTAKVISRRVNGGVLNDS